MLYWFLVYLSCHTKQKPNRLLLLLLMLMLLLLVLLSWSILT